MIENDLNEAINQYNRQTESDQPICDLLAKVISNELHEAEYRIWHAHPVWFLNGNPIVGYSKQKKGIKLLFWSGKDFDEINLNIIGQKFKDAAIFYNNVKDIKQDELIRWLKKSIEIQWDYKNIVKRKGKLEKIEQLLPPV